VWKSREKKKKNKIINDKPKISKLQISFKEVGATEMISTISKKVIFGCQNPSHTLSKHNRVVNMLPRAMHELTIFMF
jgi:hypothetical protein